MGFLSFFSVVEFFHLQPDYFPETTKDFFTVDEILQYGILPLGLKTNRSLGSKGQLVNVGFLRPRETPIVAQVTQLVREKHPSLSGLVRYQIRLDEYLTILEKIYTIDSEKLIDRSPQSLAVPLQEHVFPSLESTPS